jgi:hypothetical protein
MVELLYSDQVGAQRTITRFGLIPAGDSWLATVNRHWYLDWDGPRPDRDVSAAVDVVRRDREAAERRTVPESENAPAADAESMASDELGAANDGAARDANTADLANSPRSAPSGERS